MKQRRHATHGYCLVASLCLLALASSSTRADVLTFDDIVLGADGTAFVFGQYPVPPAPPDSFLVQGDFEARGPGALSSLTPETFDGSGVITTSLAAFGGTTISLVSNGVLPFNLLSIDLAREFQFNDPSAGVSYPEVTFTGTKAGGGTVSQSFLVDQQGFFFETFAFSSDFTNLVSVSWTQPAFGVPDPNNPGRSLGLHQFDNIHVNPVPEPASLALVGGGVVLFALGRSWRRRNGRKPA